MSTLRRHWEVPAFLVATFFVAVYVVASPGFGNDWALDPLTGLVAIVATLLACSQLAQFTSDRRTSWLWAIVVAVLALVCCANFFESLSDRLGEYFGSDDLDDHLLLLAGPCLLLLAYLGSARAQTRRIAWAGLAVQVASAAFDLIANADGINEPAAVWSLLTDFGEFLSASLYLLAVYYLVFDAARALSTVTDKPVQYGGWIRGDQLYPPPFILGWHLPPSNTPAGRVHRLCNEALWPIGDITASARNLILIALWPFVAGMRSAKQVRKNGEAVVQLMGKSKARQFEEQLKLAVHLRIPPKYYYLYELYRPEQQRRAAQYLMRYETKEIAYRLLYPIETDLCLPTPLKDKVAFARRCAKYGLRHAPTLFVFESGEPEDPKLPAIDLFLKPVRGKSGTGAERWTFVGDGRYSDGGTRVLTTEGLLTHIQELSRYLEPYIVQPAFRNHSSLRDLSPSALCTARMLTCRNEKGGFELTDAAFRMPANARSAVDDFHAGGIASSVEVTTGKLGPATDLGATGGAIWHERHPHTGATIVGRSLPAWQDAVALVERAHSVFGDYALVGWDVAFLEDGPALIEGNRGPDIDIIQRTRRGPVGNRRFGTLLAHCLERRFEPHPNA
ncbi:MAG TPA: sugar-transfer associated ATP-grasp domain-containing protein [Dongiaceae bacterium]